MTKNTIKDYNSLKQELDELIIQLQDDNTSIDQSLELYQRGVEITRKLSNYLHQAENKLSQIDSQLKDK